MQHRVLVLGQSPSTRVTPAKNHTHDRLNRWMNTVGYTKQWSFHNIIPTTNSCDKKEVDVTSLLRAVENKTRVIALGNLVSDICKKYNIDHLRVDHPSPRNRKFNDPTYESRIVIPAIDKYLND